MKQLFKLSIIIIVLSTSCQAQKLVQKSDDAKKLEINKDKFVGKPLKVLLAQIAPKIIFVYGNPDNQSLNTVGGTYLKFHFVEKAEYLHRDSKKQKPTGIIVNFQLDPNNSHKPLPSGGLKEWTNEHTQEYGDMIVINLRVTGEN
jgi:hypothetical protein